MLQVLGRLHPVLVHFPIALLLAALVGELLRRRKEGLGEAAFFCLVLGTLGALLAALSGWLFAEHDPPGVPTLLLRHRWSGIGAAASACVTLLWAWRWRRSAAPALARPTRLGLVLTGVLVAVSGHLGGEMVYGEGFALEPLGAKTEPLREKTPLQPPLPPVPVVPDSGALEPGPEIELEAAESPLDPDAAPTPAPIDYLADIQPILERHCYECHGDRKRPKGHLRLSDLASVFARDASDAAIVPGRPEESPVYQRIVLPADDEDVMPPDDAPIPSEEIEEIRRWIAEGAHWSEGAAASDSQPVPRPEDSREDAQDSSMQASPSLHLDEAQRSTRDAALARLRARGAHARRLSLADDGVEVDLGVATPQAGDADLALLAGLEPCLVELSLARTAVSDSGLERLAAFRGLRRLRLEHTAIGARAMVPLAGLPALESLDLFDTRVGDDALPSLEAMPVLARLYTGESALGEAALERLERTRPGLVVERGRLPAAAADPR